MEVDWDRYGKVLFARRSGLTLREAGALVGVSGERARQMEHRAIVAILKKKALMHLAPVSERELRMVWRYWPEVKSSD